MDGLGMLLAGSLSLRIWTGKLPPIELPGSGSVDISGKVGYFKNQI